jgi:hypothetical protein
MLTACRITFGRPPRRVTLLFALLFFGLGAAQDGYGFRFCPHHDVAGEAHHGQEHDHRPATHSHAAHDGEPASEQHTGGCSCIGACATAGDFASGAPESDAPAVRLHSTNQSPRWYDTRFVPALLPHVLPYSQAPPLDV